VAELAPEARPTEPQTGFCRHDADRPRIFPVWNRQLAIEATIYMLAWPVLAQPACMQQVKVVMETPQRQEH
jgi:hypothetical protein